MSVFSAAHLVPMSAGVLAASAGGAIHVQRENPSEPLATWKKVTACAMQLAPIIAKAVVSPVTIMPLAVKLTLAPVIAGIVAFANFGPAELANVVQIALAAGMAGSAVFFAIAAIAYLPTGVAVALFWVNAISAIGHLSNARIWMSLSPPAKPASA